MVAALRWVLTVPAALAGWYAGVLIGLLVVRIGDWFCPARYRVSGSCFAPWSEAVFTGAVALGAAVAGGLVVVLPALVAPLGKRTVATVAFLAGLGVGLYFAAHAVRDFAIPLAAAVIAGAAALWRVCRRWPRFTPER